MTLNSDFYIIESLSSNDIKDGKILFDALSSVKKYNPIYKEVNTKKEFQHELEIFSNSCYKYLFISSHGDEENIILNKGKINAYDIQEMNIKIKERRIFMSTCKGGSFLLAKYFLQKGAYSLIGTPINLPQIVATSLWTTMVIVFDRLNNKNIQFKELDKTIKLMTNIYKVPFAYYSFKRDKKEMKEYLYSNESNRKRKDYPI